MAELTMTVQDFVDAGACYEHEQIEELFAGREALTALDVLELDIPDDDKLWAVLRERLTPERTLHLIAVEFARAALTREREAGRAPDERAWRALDVKLAWMDGRASNEDLTAAWAAAWAAADAAARSAARSARSAAWAAAWAAADAAADAARSAAWAAAWAAADAAADAARAEQVDIVRRMLRGER